LKLEVSEVRRSSQPVAGWWLAQPGTATAHEPRGKIATVITPEMTSQALFSSYALPKELLSSITRRRLAGLICEKAMDFRGAGQGRRMKGAKEGDNGRYAGSRKHT